MVLYLFIGALRALAELGAAAAPFTTGILQLLASAWDGLEILGWMHRLEHDLWHLYRNVETRADRLAYDIRTKEKELRPILGQLG